MFVETTWHNLITLATCIDGAPASHVWSYMGGLRTDLLEEGSCAGS